MNDIFFCNFEHSLNSLKYLRRTVTNHLLSEESNNFFPKIFFFPYKEKKKIQTVIKYDGADC